MDAAHDTAKTVEAAEAHAEVAVKPDVVAVVKKVNARRVKSERKPRPRKAATATSAAPRSKPAKPAPIKETAVNYDATNWMNQFSTALPGADRFQNLFAGATERGQQFAERSQKAAGEIAELTRANVEALVETGKIAAAGAQTLGQEALARTRENLEQTTQQVRSLTQAGSPTEFFQLHSEIARTQFDRMVAESSRFAESFVKLAGEAFQPLSTRAALNAEKINEITA